MTTSEGSSPAARLLERWWRHEAARKIERLPSSVSKNGKTRNPYARHAAFFNVTLLPACRQDEAVAAAVIDAFFEEKPEHTNAWYFGRFQTAYRLLKMKVDKRAEFAGRARQRASEEAVERMERSTPPPSPSTPQGRLVSSLAAELKAPLPEPAWSKKLEALRKMRALLESEAKPKDRQA